jgi:uncharacterized protein (UPF0333 family)
MKNLFIALLILMIPIVVGIIIYSNSFVAGAGEKTATEVQGNVARVVWTYNHIAGR